MHVLSGVGRTSPRGHEPHLSHTKGLPGSSALLPYLWQAYNMGEDVSIHWVACSQPLTSVLQVRSARRPPVMIIMRVRERASMRVEMRVYVRVCVCVCATPACGVWVSVLQVGMVPFCARCVGMVLRAHLCWNRKRSMLHGLGPLLAGKYMLCQMSASCSLLVLPAVC